MMDAADLGGLSESLACDPATGIWNARRSAPVSYPADGNTDCFELEDASFWFRHRNRCITAAVRQFPPAGFILDVGGGNGYVARALIDSGYPTVVLEPGPEGALNARQNRRIPDVICSTLEDAGLRPASVRAVGLFDVLEHIEDDRAFVERLHALVQPDGYVYVTVPAFEWLWSATDIDAGHYRRYRAAGLSARFEAAGFDARYVTYFFEALLPPVYVMRKLPFSLGLAGQRSPSDYQAEHGGGGVLSAWLQALLVREVTAIAQGRTLAFGTSCLLVAQRRKFRDGGR